MERIHITQHTSLGALWFSGWLFSIGYLKLDFWMGLLGFIVWLVNKVPGWLSSRRATVHGSPSTERYWRARLTEALAHQARNLGQVRYLIELPME